MTTTGISLRMRETHQKKIIQASATLEISVASFIVKALDKALADTFPVILGKHEKGECRLSAVITTTTKKQMMQVASKYGLRANEWAKFALLSYTDHILLKSTPDIVAQLDAAFNKESLANNGLSYRKQQHALSRAMLQQLADGVIGLNEALTGTGKAYACVAAASAYAYATSNKVVISTYTRALQKQLEDTYALLNKVSGTHTRCATIYGKRNYVSPIHLQEILDENDGIAEGDITRCKAWAKKTNTWLAIELSELVDIDTFPMDLVVIPDNCDDPEALAPYREAMDKVKDADVVITSHHMLFYAMMSKTQLFGFPINHVIFDEAHLIESAAHSILGIELSFASLRWGANKLSTELSMMGKAKQAKDFQKWSFTLLNFEKAIVGASEKGADSLILKNRTMNCPVLSQSQSNLAILSQIPKLPKTVKLQGTALRALMELKRSTQVFAALHTGNKQDMQNNDIYASLSPVRRYVRVIATSRWYIAKDLERILWKKLQAACLVSATIFLPTSSGSESPIEFVTTLGLKDMSYQAEPPFFESWVYDNVSIYTAPKEWPEPTSKEGDSETRDQWLNNIVKLTDELNAREVSAVHGGIMVLCTSYEDANDIASKLSQKGCREIILYKQGDDMRQIQKKFAKLNGAGLLVALGGFWTGVDFPRRILTDQIITRLPISSATSQSVMSRFTYIKEKMGFPAAFATVLLPRMGIMLRQGIGRVVRTPTDKGRVYITDPRVQTRTSWRVKTLLRKYEPINEIKLGEIK